MGVQTGAAVRPTAIDLAVQQSLGGSAARRIERAAIEIAQDHVGRGQFPLVAAGRGDGDGFGRAAEGKIATSGRYPAAAVEQATGLDQRVDLGWLGFGHRTRKIAARPRKMKKPALSVSAVSITPDPITGSRPKRCSISGISTPEVAATSRFSSTAAAMTTASLKS